MRRLYLRIYFAVLASLALFALGAGVLWHAVADPHGGEELAALIARNVLPPPGAPPAEQQAALERLARDVRADLALFSPDGARLASIGKPLPMPERSGWQPGRGGPHWATQLEDGRWLSARMSRQRRGAAFGLSVLALILVAIAVGAYPVVRRLTKRLERLQHGVEALGAGELSARVKVEGRDEVARLAESFNRAAVRIEELVAAHKTLLANASHELRTPLARIRMALELGKDKREVERDIAELDALIDEVLLASRLDAVASLENIEEVDLLALAAEEAAHYDVEAHGEPTTMKGDPRLMRRMIRNLLENARRHGAPPIELSVRNRELRVCDAGPGVPQADRERIFEPFNSKLGTGLGLALVRQIARRHGGDARCEGNCFVVRFE
ncbi:MAG TPA: ATP-binding protein [Burkholderiales bacterium]|nr:ATP-binding protein [Burkholderiales bacterium]